jgi:hypothetical protein
VGKKLSDLTTKRLIIVVLVMLFSVAIFDYTTYVTPPDANEYALYLLAAFPENSKGFNLSFEAYLQDATSSITPLVLLSAGNFSWNSDIDAGELRSNEQ